MSLLWPGFLLLLGLVPLIVGVYVWTLRRRRVALRYSSLSLVRAALPRYSHLRRHLPFALFVLALSSLIVALGRPVQIVSVPSGQATIILALDASGSMRQNDIPPSRLQAAQAAALSFIQQQKSSTQIGLVAFAGYSQLIQPPTSDQEALEVAVESLTTARGTAIGSGILESLDAIAEIDPNVAPSVDDFSSGPLPTPVPRGAYAPHIIVLLTDGVATTGPYPLDAAQQAADRGVRVYTIGFGTEAGSPGFGPGGGFGGGRQQSGGGGFRRGIDEETLKQIAEMTDGEYYSASSADELLKVFQELPTYLITRHEVMEISVLFAAIGAVLVAGAMGLAMRWHPLP
ncbi:MAG TPA: VWA domain-containing protein [Chloroflexia bacterium]|jgi:Ca-activated chloride channel family protein|nr:VWA domain-containing protein [Chloroflexia bacterium]